MKGRLSEGAGAPTQPKVMAVLVIVMINAVL